MNTRHNWKQKTYFKVIAICVLITFLFTSVGIDSVFALQAPYKTQALAFGPVFQVGYALAKAQKIVGLLEDGFPMKEATLDEVAKRQVFLWKDIQDSDFKQKPNEILITIADGLILRYYKKKDTSDSTDERVPAGTVSAAQWDLDEKWDVIGRQLLYTSELHGTVLENADASLGTRIGLSSPVVQSYPSLTMEDPLPPNKDGGKGKGRGGKLLTSPLAVIAVVGAAKLAGFDVMPVFQGMIAVMVFGAAVIVLTKVGTYLAHLAEATTGTATKLPVMEQFEDLTYFSGNQPGDEILATGMGITPPVVITMPERAVESTPVQTDAQPAVADILQSTGSSYNIPSFRARVEKEEASDYGYVSVTKMRDVEWSRAEKLLTLKLRTRNLDSTGRPSPQTPDKFIYNAETKVVEVYPGHGHYKEIYYPDGLVRYIDLNSGELMSGGEVYRDGEYAQHMDYLKSMLEDGIVLINEGAEVVAGSREGFEQALEIVGGIERGAETMSAIAGIKGTVNQAVSYAREEAEYYEDTVLLKTKKIYDNNGDLVEEYGYYKDVSNLMMYRLIPAGDENRNIYYSFLNEDFDSRGYGRVDKEVRISSDVDGIRAYRYEYYSKLSTINGTTTLVSTKKVRTKYCYAGANIDNLFNPVLIGSPVQKFGYYDDDANLLMYKYTPAGDGDGNVYYNFLNEDFNGRGYGRVDKEVHVATDSEGIRAYQYEYYVDSIEVDGKQVLRNTGKVRVKYCYAAAEITDLENPLLLGDWLQKYGYYNDNANLAMYKHILAADTKGNVYYHFLNEDFNERGYGRVDKEIRAVADGDGAMAYQYEYFSQWSILNDSPTSINSERVRARHSYTGALAQDLKNPILPQNSNNVSYVYYDYPGDSPQVYQKIVKSAGLVYQYYNNAGSTLEMEWNTQGRNNIIKHFSAGDQYNRGYGDLEWEMDTNIGLMKVYRNYYPESGTPKYKDIYALKEGTKNTWGYVLTELFEPEWSYAGTTANRNSVESPQDVILREISRRPEHKIPRVDLYMVQNNMPKLDGWINWIMKARDFSIQGGETKGTRRDLLAEGHVEEALGGTVVPAYGPYVKNVRMNDTDIMDIRTAFSIDAGGRTFLFNSVISASVGSMGDNSYTYTLNLMSMDGTYLQSSPRKIVVNFREMGGLYLINEMTLYKDNEVVAVIDARNTSRGQRTEDLKFLINWMVETDDASVKTVIHKYTTYHTGYVWYRDGSISEKILSGNPSFNHMWRQFSADHKRLTEYEFRWGPTKMQYLHNYRLRSGTENVWDYVSTEVQDEYGNHISWITDPAQVFTGFPERAPVLERDIPVLPQSVAAAPAAADAQVLQAEEEKQVVSQAPVLDVKDHPAIVPKAGLEDVPEDERLSIADIVALGMTANHKSRKTVTSDKYRDAVAEYIKESEALLKKVTGNPKKPVCIRVPIEILEAAKDENTLAWLRALNTRENVYIELYMMQYPDLEMDSTVYQNYRIVQKEFKLAIAKDNTITLFAANAGDDKGQLKKQLQHALQQDSRLRDSIVVPVGLKGDYKGVIRGTIFGISLIQIARNPKNEQLIDKIIKEYERVVNSYWSDTRQLKLTRDNVLALVMNSKIPSIVQALMEIIESLPMERVPVEDISDINARARAVAESV